MCDVNSLSRQPPMSATKSSIGNIAVPPGYTLVAKADSSNGEPPVYEIRKAFACPACNRNYISAGSLRNHLRTKHKERRVLTKPNRVSNGPNIYTSRAPPLSQTESDRVIDVTGSLSYSSMMQPSPSANIYRPYHVPSPLDTGNSGSSGRSTGSVLNALSLSSSDWSNTSAFSYAASHIRGTSSATESPLYNTTPLQSSYTVRHTSSAPPSLNTSPLLLQSPAYAAAVSNWCPNPHDLLASTLAEPAVEPVGVESGLHASIRAMGAVSWENLLTALLQSELSGFVN